MAKKRKRGEAYRRPTIKNFKYFSFAFGAYMIQWFLLLWFGDLPWYLLIAKVVLSLPVLVMLWMPKFDIPTTARWLVTLVLVAENIIVWFNYTKSGILSQLVLLPVAVGICFFIAIKLEHTDIGLILCGMEATHLFLLLFTSTGRYSFMSDGIAFWQVTLGVAVPVGVLIMWRWLWQKAKHIWGRLGWFLLCTFLVAVVVWSYTAHLNYALDTSTPTTHNLVIEGKDRDNHRKSADDYEFIFTQNGETFSVEVSFAEYGAYDIGDTYTLILYGGAFDEPFYASPYGVGGTYQ